MGFVFGLIVLTAIFSTFYLICKYKNIDALKQDLDELEQELAKMEMPNIEE